MKGEAVVTKKPKRGEMTWQDVLRAERRRKLKVTSLMIAGHLGTHLLRDGVRFDTTEETIAANIEYIAEIDAILEAAGEPV